MTDRHPKWTRVEAGTIIPAGQPYRVEWAEWEEMPAAEYVCRNEFTVRTRRDAHFVDSSWKPPLVLPTEPGSVVEAEGPAQIKRLWFCRSDRTWINENGTINEATALTVLHRVLFDAGTAR